MKRLNDLLCMISDLKTDHSNHHQLLLVNYVIPVMMRQMIFQNQNKEKIDYTENSHKGKMLRICKFDSLCGFERRKIVSHDPKTFDGLMMHLQKCAMTHSGFEIYNDGKKIQLGMKNGFNVIAIISM